MLLEREQNYDLGMDALVTACFWNMIWAWMLWSPYNLETRTELGFGHGCSDHRMLLEHERNYDLSMDALVAVCSWNRNGIMVREWFGHGCSGQRMLLQHERNLGMDALVTVSSGITNGVMIWAWMLRYPYALGTRTEL